MANSHTDINLNEVTPLEFLVVEDNPDNIAAAKLFFSRKDIAKAARAEYATCYEQGRQMLEAGKERYRRCIFDLQLPEKEGDKPLDKSREEATDEAALKNALGWKLVDLADKYCIPWAVITYGLDHGTDGEPSSKMSYFWRENRELRAIKNARKDTPWAWEIAYKQLINPWYDDNNLTYRLFKEIYQGMDIARVIHHAILNAPDKHNICAGPNISLKIAELRRR